MMAGVSDAIGGWLGWCPCCRTGAGTAGPDAAPWMERQDTGRQPGTPTGTVMVPAGFTALSLALLFATYFVGGETWWPAFVFGIAAAGIVTMAARPGRGGT